MTDQQLDRALVAWYGYSDVAPDKRERMRRTLEIASTETYKLSETDMWIVRCPTCGELVTEYAVAEHRTRHEGETP